MVPKKIENLNLNHYTDGPKEHTKKLVPLAHSVYSPRLFCLAIISLKLWEMVKVSSFFSFNNGLILRSNLLISGLKINLGLLPVVLACESIRCFRLKFLVSPECRKLETRAEKTGYSRGLQSCWPAQESLAWPSLRKQLSSLLAAWWKFPNDEERGEKAVFAA